MEEHPVSRLYHDNTSLSPSTAPRLFETQVPPMELPHPHVWMKGEEISLPGKMLKASLNKLMPARTSARKFDSAAVPFKTLGSILQTSFTSGELRDDGLPQRPYPSAGGLYPVSCFLFARNISGLETGIYHINGDRVSLFKVKSLAQGEMDDLLASTIMGEPWLYQAAGFIVMAGDLERSKAKYGERAYRFVLLEAGHIAQNIELSATAAKVGHLCLGGFCEQALGQALELPESHSIVYAMALGLT